MFKALGGMHDGNMLITESFHASVERDVPFVLECLLLTCR